MGKKVAIFTSSLAGGGMERAMLNVASYLSSQDASVDFLVASSKGPLLEEAHRRTNLIDLSTYKGNAISFRWWLLKSVFLVEPIFLILLFIKRLPKSVRAIPAIVEYITNNSPDVILSTPTASNLAILWAARYCNYNKKLIVREATTLSQEIIRTQTHFNKLIGLLVPKWYNYSHAVICVSAGVGEDLVSNYKIKKERIIILPNIINADEIKTQANSNEHDHLISSWKPFILSAGRLDETKNYETLIKAFYKIYKKTECKLVILGEGSERKRLENLITKLSLNDYVYMPGFFINPYPFIKHCEIFALTSKLEGSPNVLKEALLLNKKVVSTDCASGINEILGNGKYGTIVPVGDYKSLSKELLALKEADSSSAITEIEKNNRLSIIKYKALCL